MTNNQIILIFCLLIAIVFPAKAQRKNVRFNVGIEQDVLPYMTGGYYLGAWAGKKNIRVRFLLASVNKPDFIVPEGFTNNHVNAYALLGDYFLRDNWSGWWLGGGLVYWDSRIQSDAQISTVSYENILLNGSLGYSWKFWKNFYVSPWAGMHIRVGGAQEVTVDGKSFNTPLLNPEASIKVGWHF
jgi:hypothetical protein